MQFCDILQSPLPLLSCSVVPALDLNLQTASLEFVTNRTVLGVLACIKKGATWRLYSEGVRDEDKLISKHLRNLPKDLWSVSRKTGSGSQGHEMRKAFS